MSSFDHALFCTMPGCGAIVHRRIKITVGPRKVKCFECKKKSRSVYFKKWYPIHKAQKQGAK